MSTYWGYRCETCGENSDEWFNHGDADLAEMARQWPSVKSALATLEAANWRFDAALGCPDVLSFLRAHEGHTLVLRNEYDHTRPLE